MRGELFNFNTIEEFKSADKQVLFNQHVQKVRAFEMIALRTQLHARFCSCEALTAADLACFFVLTFADLKKFKFTHWFAFPALIANPAWTIADATLPLAKDVLGEERLREVEAAWTRHAAASPLEAACCAASIGSGEVRTARIADWSTLEDPVLVFLDSTSSATAVGWQLRNMLAFLALRFQISSVKVLCLRSSLESSRLIDLTLAPNAYAKVTGSGWERNSAGKLGPRVADLGPMMDPQRDVGVFLLI